MWRRSAMVAGVLLLVTAGVAPAQQRAKRPVIVLYPGPAPKVSRMDVYNGANHTVTYYGRNVTLGDRVILRELSDAESDPASAVPVVGGYNNPVAPVGYFTGGYYNSYFTGGYYNPYYVGGYYSPFLTGGYYNPPLPVYNQPYRTSGIVASGGAPTVLSNGGVVAASDEESGNVRQHRRFMALARVGGSPRLREAFGMDDVIVPLPAQPSQIKPTSAEEDKSPAAVLTLTDGKRIVCSSLEENGTWVVATKTDGKTLKLRASQILRIEESARK